MTATATKLMNRRQTKYPPRIVAFARRLHTENGRSVQHIQEQLAQRGYAPKRDTLLYWIDDDFREAKLMQQRAKRRKGVGRRGVPARRKAWRYRLDRMEELRRLGLSYRDIAALMTNDFEDLELTEHQVTYILKGKASTHTICRLLWPQGQDRKAGS